MNPKHFCPLIGCALSLSLGLLGSPTAHLAQNEPTPTPPQPLIASKVIEDLARAGSADDLGKQHERLFRGMPPAMIRQLAAESPDSLALRAAWEEVKRTLPENKTQRIVAPERSSMCRFCGFVEGRIKTALPEWWEKMLLSCRSYGRDWVSFPIPPEEELPYHATGDGFRAPKNTKLRKANGNVEISVGTSVVRVPERIVLEQAEDHVSAVVFDDVAYVALHSNTGTPYSIVCLDQKTSALRWKSTVWATYRVGGFSGIHVHCVSLVSAQKRVIAFGGGNDGMYIEGFDQATGKALWRFGTTY